MDMTKGRITTFAYFIKVTTTEYRNFFKTGHQLTIAFRHPCTYVPTRMVALGALRADSPKGAVPKSSLHPWVAKLLGGSQDPPEAWTV